MSQINLNDRQLDNNDLIFDAPGSGGISRADEYELSNFSPGANLTLALTSEDTDVYDPYLQLIDAETGAILASNDDVSGSNLNSQINGFSLENGRQYKIRVSSYGTLSEEVNNYELFASVDSGTLSLTPKDTEFGEDLIGSTFEPVNLEGELDGQDFTIAAPSGGFTVVDEYQLSSNTIGAEITIALIGETNGYDPYLEVIDARNGTVIDADDNSGGGLFGTNSLISNLQLSDNLGDYRIRVSSATPFLSSSLNVADYRLQVSTNQGQVTVNPKIDTPPPEISISDVSQNEGNAGANDFEFTVSLSQASNQTVTVDYTTVNDTAIAGQDYVAKNGTLEFAPGETQKAIAIEVIGDSDIEQDESFKVNLSSPSNAEIGTSSVTGIIQNDDINPVDPVDPEPLMLAGGTAQIAYVAYYGRPADQGGLDFWNDNLAQNNVSYSPQQGDGLTGQEEDVYNQIVNQFGTADEADRLFGGFGSNREKVNQVYQFAFNRDGDAEGLDYWTSQIEQGNVTLATFALEVALGAQNDDIITLNNKVESADMFTDDVNTKGINAYSGSYGENFGRNWLGGYGETVSSQAELDSALTDLVNGSPI